jgi:hypothetical protein
VVEEFFSRLGPYLAFAAPFVAIAASCWLISRTERIVHAVFPYLEWEHSLGSFNIKAERRANLGLRILRVCVYVMLFDALFGILWGAKALPLLANWSDPWVMGELALRMPALGFCLGIWLIYIGAYFIPKFQAERDHKLWKKMQAEIVLREEERRMRGDIPTKSRVRAPLRKPRTNAPLGTPKKPAATSVQRIKRWNGPGG